VVVLMKEEKLLKILKELLRNSRRSDRELAKVIGASQPTVTRNRRLLSQYIRSYTVVPEFSEIGYEILALTFAKARTYSRKEVEAKLAYTKEWVMRHPNIIFASDGEGLGKDAVMVSLHKNYSQYADFMREFSIDFADFVGDSQSFIISLKTGLILKPLDMTYLVDDLERL
jgi:DNA-binding Lrp family transcriptional regulator